MQLFSIISTLVLAFKCVSAENEIRFIFNLGLSETPTAGCHLESERKLIDDALNSFSGRRSLGLFDGLFDGISEDERSTTKRCADICAGIAAGTCWKKGCRGFRKLRNSSRDLSYQTCFTEMNAIHAKLDAVITKVATNSCKTFLQRTRRTAKCYPDLAYGQIEGIRVWKNVKGALAMTDTVLLPHLSFSVCQYQKFTIETMNEPCVKSGTLSLSGQNKYNRTRIEYTPPFTLFGDDGVQFITDSINTTGVFDLTITPDFDTNKTKKFSVFVTPCRGI